MENFDWSSFTRKVAIKADKEKIYKAWSLPEEIEKWFLRTADYQRNKLATLKTEEVKQGDEYAWTWYLYDVLEKGTIQEANGADRFSFTFAGNCTVLVELSSLSGYTQVTLTQSNIPLDDKSKRDIRLGCDSGWSFYLVNLKAWLEHGVDLRNQDEAIRPMVNN